MKLNKQNITMLLLIIILSFSGCSKNNGNRNNVQSDCIVNGIYIMYKDNGTKIKYLSTDYKLISGIEVTGGWDLCAVGNNKVYITIAGNADMVGDSVKVINNGQITNTIDLTYDMPLNVKYNLYDGCAYITHKYKVTYNDENCISIIDTKKDVEIDSFMYDEYIYDITFSQNSRMYIASQNVETYKKHIDIVNLEDKSIEKSIVLDTQLTSIAYCEETQLLYGISTHERDGILYAINCIDGTIRKISLEHSDPSQIVINNKEGNPLIYISNMYKDANNEGHIITVYNPITEKVENEFINVNRVQEFIVDNDLFAVAKTLDKAYKINLNNGMKKTIDISYPTRIAKAH